MIMWYTNRIQREPNHFSSALRQKSGEVLCEDTNHVERLIVYFSLTFNTTILSIIILKLFAILLTPLG